MIPHSIQIPLCYDRTEPPRYEGGFAQVWKGKHKGMEVAVKVLKVTMESDIVKIKRVGFLIFQGARADRLVPTA